MPQHGHHERETLVPFAQSPPRFFEDPLCDGVTARGVESFEQLRALHRRLQDERPECRVLASLDDLGQASYTSGHAIESFELDDMAGQGAAGPAEAFSRRLANLRERSRDVTFSDVVGVLDWETTGDDNDLLTINRDPEQWLDISIEPEILMQFVPVDRASDVIAAFPNGYFRQDLNPMQNLVLAQRLEQEHGLSIFGIGARSIAFCSDLVFDAARSRALAGPLVSVYADSPDGAADELADLIVGRDWVLLRYTES